MFNEITEKIWLTWKNEAGEAFKVGELHRRGGKYYFKYIIEEVNKAKEFGFEVLPFLPKVEVEYFREGLFRTFMDRVPNSSSKGIEEILKQYDIEQYDEFELLRKTGGKLDVDTFEFLDPETVDFEG